MHQETASAQTVQQIPLDLLDEPFLPQRSKFSDDKFAELVEDIAANGVTVPLLVRPVGERFQVVAGHRRMRASQVAGRSTAPCIVEVWDDRQALLKMISENTGREEPSDAEQGRHYLEIAEKFEVSEEDVARMFNKSVAHVQSRCDLVRRFPEISAANEENKISWAVSQQLCRVNPYTACQALRVPAEAITDGQATAIKKHQLMLLDLCIEQGATGRLANSYVEQWKRSLIPMNAYDPNVGQSQAAPSAPVALDRCVACGESSDQGAMVTLKVHSWEKAAALRILAAAGMAASE